MSIKIRKLDSSTENFQKSLHAVLAFEASEDEAIERSVAQILADVKARSKTKRSNARSRRFWPT